MGERERIADQLKRAFEGGAWHGAALRELLAGVDAARAAARPVPEAHTIWELVLHVHGTHELVLRRLRGDARPLTEAEDWPRVEDASEEAWRAAVAELERSYAELQAALPEVDEATLHEPVLPQHSSTYVTLHGLIQHDLYHAGQIGLLAKAAPPA